MRTRTGQSVWLASRYAPYPEHICRTLGRGLGKSGEDHPDLFGPTDDQENK